jgi:hypothetical protein
VESGDIAADKSLAPDSPFIQTLARPGHLVRNAATVVDLIAVSLGPITRPVPHGVSDQIHSSLMGNSRGDASLSPAGGAKLHGRWAGGSCE